METVTLTIDGRQVTVEKGKTVLQAAIASGISVPYYCYHPGISIDGSCRVCIVKIEKMPKLQTSCSTTCSEGMVVSTRTQEVIDARAGVFEFLLVNHPLDCPVCDKGGECPLQDFSYQFGPDQSRMDFPRREFDGNGVKADVDFGPTLMLNRNRCILCTRCVRFMRDIDSDAQINIIDRGNGSQIATFQEEGVHSLLSGNLMDVCPVGAITTRDYRFKSRPWDNPLVTDTIALGELEHKEHGVHVNVAWWIPINDRIDIAVSVGPSFIFVSQEVATSPVVDDGTQNVTGFVKEKQSGTAFGVNVGFDGTYLFTPRFGAGLLIRYAGGSTDLPNLKGLSVGGFQIGLGLRMRF
jgi:ferredoxin